MSTTQTVTAIYENGVLTPLEKVNLRKRQKVRVKISTLNGKKRKTAASSRATLRPNTKRDEQIKQRIRDSFGIWANRKDIGDAVDWVNQIRSGWDERWNELYQDA